MKKRLTRRGNIGYMDSSKLPSYVSIYEKLRKYENAEEEGGLVVLQCKVGDTVFAIENKHVEVFEVIKIEFKQTVFGNCTYFLEKPEKRGLLYRYYDGDYDQTIFLTHEKAAKALGEIIE